VRREDAIFSTQAPLFCHSLSLVLPVPAITFLPQPQKGKPEAGTALIGSSRKGRQLGHRWLR